MATRKTIWQWITNKEPVEFTLENPIKAKIGTIIDMSDDPELCDYEFKVGRIIETKHKDGTLTITDYDLVGRMPGSESINVRLRFLPLDDPDTAAGRTHEVLLLRLFDEFGYDNGGKGLEENLSRDCDQFNVPDVGSYFRVREGLDKPYEATVRVASDRNADGEIELSSYDIEYWDFWADFNDDNPRKEWLFVELDSSHDFRLWRGTLHEQRVGGETLV